MAKLYSSEIAVRAAEDGVQIHGGYGFVKDYPAEKFFRDVKLTTIGEGTSEIQRLVIARQLLLPESHDETLGPRCPTASDRRPRASAGDRARDRARDLARRRRGAGRPRRWSAAIFPQTGRAYLVGVTGPPGAGKSTLVDRLIARDSRRRDDGRRDRRRSDEPVHRRRHPRRSRAHAGARGRCRRVHPQHGDARPPRRPGARDAAMPRWCSTPPGTDVVIIETVGVGQDEVDIVRTADVSIVVLVPGTGDDVQALKAGIMEIADIFVVNKADREGADRVVHVDRVEPVAADVWRLGEWRPPILKTEATTGAGVAELWTDDRPVPRACGERRIGSRAGGNGTCRGCASSWRIAFMRARRADALPPGEFERYVDAHRRAGTSIRTQRPKRS